MLVSRFLLRPGAALLTLGCILTLALPGSVRAEVDPELAAMQALYQVLLARGGQL